MNTKESIRVSLIVKDGWSEVNADRFIEKIISEEEALSALTRLENIHDAGITLVEDLGEIVFYDDLSEEYVASSLKVLQNQIEAELDRRIYFLQQLEIKEARKYSHELTLVLEGLRYIEALSEDIPLDDVSKAICDLANILERYELSCDEASARAAAEFSLNIQSVFSIAPFEDIDYE